MNTTIATVLGIIAVPFSTILAFCAILLGLFSFDEKRKKSIKQNIEKIFPEQNSASRFSAWWIQGFYTLFGKKPLAARQLLTIPFFTSLYAIILFVIWYGWVLIFMNPKHIIPHHLPTSISVAVHDFIHYGFWYSLILDAFSIFLTRHYIKLGQRKSFTSRKAIFYFAGSVVAMLFLFTIIIYWLRLQAVEELYISQGLYLETRPEMKWQPFHTLYASLNLIENEIFIVVTSKGWISNYFIPQSLMLYASLITQLTLVVIFSCFLISRLLLKTKRLSLALVDGAGTPKQSAWGFSILAILMIVFLVIMGMTIAAFIPGST